MKAKNILMSVLLAMGFIAAKAAPGYPPELALVSQPVLVYNYNSITVYYDVQNIGDHTYRGDICLFLSPDNGYCYAEKYVKVCPGRIKRVAIEIPAYRPNPSYVYTIMPYYEMGEELYSFTTFEYFEPLSFHWNGYHNEPWVVINVPPRPRYYNRPGSYRYYYDGFRPPMPPPGMGFGPGTPPPPMDPLHHTYGYHHNNGGYPGWHNEWNNGNTPPKPNDNGGSNAPQATVRPKANGGSMSSGNANNSGNNTPPPPPSNNANNGSNSGRTGNSGNVSRPNNNTGSNSGTVNNGSSSGRTGNSGNVSRPNNNGNSNSGNVSRPSNNNSNSGSSTGSATGRTGNSGSNVRNGNNNNGSNSGTSSGTSRGSNSTSRSGNNSGRGSR